MSEFGVAAAIASVTIPGAALIITVIKTKATSQDVKVGNSSGTCPVHHTVENTLDSMWKAIGVIQADVKELLKRG